jgi:hypothetical protein
METDFDPRKIITLLADEERFKIAAAISLEAGTLEKIASMTGLGNPVIVKTLLKLEEAGLIGKQKSGYVFNIAALQELNREIIKEIPKKPALTGLERFFKDGKLITYPKAHDDQMLVLEHIAGLFELNRRYTEKEVNEKLKGVNPDYASFRRYLVDNAFFAREHSTGETGSTVIFYWRVEHM